MAENTEQPKEQPTRFQIFKNKIDPGTWNSGVATIIQTRPELTPDTALFLQAVMDLLIGVGQGDRAKFIGPTGTELEKQGKALFGTQIVSPIVPTEPKETKKWKAAVDKGLKETSTTPKLTRKELQSFPGLSNPPAEEAISKGGVFISPGSPLSDSERTRMLELQDEQERKRTEADAAKAQLEQQREADRVAIEQLRLQKESELIQYKTDYFASPQVGIYIGDRWVGNAVTIEFTENVSKAPLYGYASTHFDAVAKGNVIVQGQLSIAYTGENYLASILRNYQTTEGGGDSVPFAVKDPIERAKKLFWNLENIHEPVLTKPLEYGYHGGKTGAVGSGFNIRVFYGAQNFLIDSFGSSGELKFSGPVQTIINVHLTSRSIVIQPTGDPIGETYTFFARLITTGVQRNSINPNRIIRSRDAQNTPIATTTGTTPTGLRNEPAAGPA